MSSENLGWVAGQVFAADGTACESAAGAVIERFQAPTASQKQDFLNFLRTL